jgi:hypothetical protein
MGDEAVKFLTNQLYPDIKSWSASLARFLTIPIKKANSPHLRSPSELLEALKLNHISVDSWVTLDCKPSAFGPFLRTHMMSPIHGMSTDMRLGPSIISDNPIMGLMAQMMTNLKPVGLYPSVSEDISQICLYPTDAEAFGFVGMMPDISNLIQYIPAVVSPKKMLHLGSASTVQGIIRCATPKMMREVGISQEIWEELRQAGSLWYLDLLSEGTTIAPHGEAVVPEMWGALYASGHIEFEGELQLKPLIDGMAESLRMPDKEIQCIQNQAARKEFLLYGKGIRAVIDSQYPVYSIHMDAEIGISFKRERERFDRVCSAFRDVIKEVAKLSAVKLLNEGDLDFTYTNSTKSFKVLSSEAAEKIADPVGLAIRDWHRRRSEVN